MRRFVLILASAFAFGLAIAVLKGQGSGVGDAFGNLSAPWLMVAFVAGFRTTSVARGALAGLAATMLALAGFYIAVALSAHYGVHSLRAGLELAFSANRRYLAAGLLSGPLLGAVGWWSSARRRPRFGLLIGCLLLGEPLVILLMSGVGPVARYASGWQSHPGAYALEFLIGTVVFAAVLIEQRGRPTPNR